MTDADRFKLLFGPYRAPALSRGDRAFCLFRDCDVIITSWTNAPIPWPRCVAPGTHGGGSGLLVDEVLAWAIRQESALALKYWWRASRNTVWKWRQAFGVGRMNNEGSRRLHQFASEAGGFANFEREFSDAEIEACRQRAIATNRIECTRAYHPLLWAAEEVRLLRKMPDDKVAMMLGRSQNAVRLKRRKMGIGKYEGVKRR